MNNDGTQDNSMTDGAWPGAVEWKFGGGPTGQFIWRCDAMRAGRLYNRTTFDTRDEAEEFARTMRQSEPDQMFSVEAIMASSVWN